MTGLLNLNNRRLKMLHLVDIIQQMLQIEAFYFDLNVVDGKIEAQNPAIYKILFIITMW